MTLCFLPNMWKESQAKINISLSPNKKKGQTSESCYWREGVEAELASLTTLDICFIVQKIHKKKAFVSGIQIFI